VNFVSTEIFFNYYLPASIILMVIPDYRNRRVITKFTKQSRRGLSVLLITPEVLIIMVHFMLHNLAVDEN